MFRAFICLIFCYAIQSNCFAQKIVSRADNLMKLFIGIGNEMHFYTKDFPKEELEIKASRGLIAKDTDSQYRYWTVEPGRVEFTYFWKGKEVGRERYEVVDWPRATATFGGIEVDGTLPIGMILSQSGISVSFMNTDIYWNAKVLEYRMRIIRDKRVVFDGLFIDFALFGAEQRKQLSYLASGDEILFSDVKYELNTPHEKSIKTTTNPYLRIKVK